MFTSDPGSERASSVEDYQNTCAEFIVRTTNEWIYRYSDTIKKIDIVMNHDINKLAENTAGYP